MGEKDIEIRPALCMVFLRKEKCFWLALGLRGSNATCKVSADTQFAGDAAKSTSVLTNAKQSLQIQPEIRNVYGWISMCFSNVQSSYKCGHLNFTVYGQRQASKHTHACA